MPDDASFQNSGSEDANAVRRRREILAAAVRCIRQFSARKVAVEDIAREAGISRRTLYRFFQTRRDIMSAVAYERLSKIGHGVEAALAKCDTFEDAIVAGTIETIRLARADRVFESLVEDDHTLILDPDPRDEGAPIRSLSAKIWLGVFRKARKDGKLRQTIREQEALSWLIEVHRLFDIRPDLSDTEIEDLLRKFVLPSLVSEGSRRRKA
ncbi:MAG TPA: helix-turn-helix domain-containing protein [Vitreimonas sp.]|jgi:AcrR family transcriptional regulator|nr:helix-turn-helix domain-containing protein [Vitreimonas sp.]